MPSFDEHIEKYKHNKSFRDKGLLNRDSEFDDWEIVVIFYTCVHLIEAIMDKEFEYHPGDDRYVWLLLNMLYSCILFECNCP